MNSSFQARRKGASGAGGLSFRLYVAGRLPGSANAEACLRALCAGHPAGEPKIEIIDVLREPGRALADGVIVTPTLDKLAPEPAVRILGALTDLKRVRLALGLGGQAHD